MQAVIQTQNGLISHFLFQFFLLRWAGLALFDKRKFYVISKLPAMKEQLWGEKTPEGRSKAKTC